MAKSKVHGVETDEVVIELIRCKILTVDGKRMTKHWIRNLRAEPLIDEDTFQFKGKLWGTVHNVDREYGSKWARLHRHVIWSDEKNLYLTPVFKDDGEWFTKYCADRAEQATAAIGLKQYLEVEPVVHDTPASKAWVDDNSQKLVRAPGHGVAMYAGFELIQALHIYWQPGEDRRPGLTPYISVVSAFKRIAYMGSLKWEELSISELSGFRERMLKAKDRAEEEYMKRWEEIEALDHIFVA